MIAWSKFDYWWSGYLEMSSRTSNSVTLKKYHKIGLSNVGKMYHVRPLLTSTHKSLCGNNCTNYFDSDPATFAE